ncbi:hypothetical protein LUV35_12085 [Vibrio cholerae]|uniref:hypothetical protein n=1 Tax=Vibrio cholerae TaxID=666 RepID=UPI001E4EE044|nr:hypothetical protein [Vibrio cholerae]MCD9211718.1 hypothetical protein [Vibrio cholerae]
MKVNINNKKILSLLIINKVFYFIFAIFVFSKFSQLGDTEDYISGHYLYREDYTSPAFLLSWLGNNLGESGSYLLSMLISIFSVLYLLHKANLTLRLKILILATIFLPSFGVWTAILSKEVFVLFFMSLSVGFLIDVYSNKRILPSIFNLACFVFLFSLKPHYSSAVFFTYLFLFFRNLGIRQEMLLSMIVFCLVIIIPLTIYYIDVIYYYTQLITNNYFINGGSTRPNNYWNDTYDFFTYAPIGVPKAFIGPTLSETINKISFLPFFIEGVVLFILILLGSFLSIYRKGCVNITSLCVFFTFTLLLMFAHYPVGIVNPGSSTRYRSGIIFPMLVFIYFLVKVNYEKKEDNFYK